MLNYSAFVDLVLNPDIDCSREKAEVDLNQKWWKERTASTDIDLHQIRSAYQLKAAAAAVFGHPQMILPMFLSERCIYTLSELETVED